MSCGSGVGKSTGASALMLWEAWRHGYQIGAFAPTNKQVKLLAHDCAEHILRGGNRFALFVSHKPTKDDPFLGLTSGGRIYFENTAYGADHSRGFEFNLAVMDEGALDKQETFEVVQTRARLKPGRVIVLSTPRGKGGWFFEQAMLAREEMIRAEHEERRPIRRFIQASSFDNPHYDRAILTMREAMVSKRVWQQEYMGEFVDLEGGTFRQEDLDRVFDATWEPESEPRPRGLYVHGWDFGQRKSYTVGTTLAFDVLDGVDGEVRGILQEERIGERWTRIYEMVNAREADWGKGSERSETIIDGTGIGTVIEESIDISALPYVFTKKSRGELLLRFTAAVERPNRLRFPRHWSMLYSSMQLHTSKEDAPGQTWDHLDSTALAYWLAHERTTFGTPFLMG